jgi:hypothetical protein
MHAGGPIEDANGVMIGAIFLIDVENHEAAASFTEQEPYHRCGLYEVSWCVDGIRYFPNSSQVPTLVQRAEPFYNSRQKECGRNKVSCATIVKRILPRLFLLIVL